MLIERLLRRGDVKGVTRGINPGLNGLEDRQRRFDMYMRGETPEGDVKGAHLRVT